MWDKAIAREDAPSERLWQDALNFGRASLMRGAAEDGDDRLDVLGAAIVERRRFEGAVGFARYERSPACWQ